MQLTDSPWFIRAAAAEQDPPLRLFCLPYAGGGASVYRGWPARLPGVEVLPVELPGRESRLGEQPYSEMAPLVTALTDAIGPELTKPYAIFGHSFGGRIGFELNREIRRRGLAAPLALFVSGCRAPHIDRVPTPKLSELPERMFAGMIRKLSGTPPEVFDDPELLKLLMPALRADFTIVDSYEYTDEPALPWPVHAFGGTEDPDAREDTLLAWQAHTSASFRLRSLPGGHFVVRTRQKEIAEAVGADLARFAAQSRL
jgi:surfactin synthase thioesterase subunit